MRLPRRATALGLATLLAVQQGLFVSEAVAQVVEGRASVPVTGGNLTVGPASVSPAPVFEAMPGLPAALEHQGQLSLEQISGGLGVEDRGGLRGLQTGGLEHAALGGLSSADKQGTLHSPVSADNIAAPTAIRGLSVLHAGPESDGQGENGEASRVFDGLKVYLTGENVEPIAADLAELGGTLAQRPGYLEKLNAKGRVRMVISKGDATLTQADREAVRKALSAHGVTARVDLESLPIDRERRASGDSADVASARPGEDASKDGWVRRWVVRPLAWPFREAAFLARTLGGSFTAPTWFEVSVGAVSKTPGLVLGIGWWSKSLLMTGHPVAFGFALGLTLALTVFHGVWINTWANFQNALGKQRGIAYQTGFNLAYMLLSGALFRFITWTALSDTIPPWSATYWRDIGVATLLGTFFGTLGFQGTNALYDKGRIPRWGRSLIQQGRDVFFTLGGAFFGTGSMTHFWTLFIAQQAFDLALYAVSQRLAKRSILYVASGKIAETEEFKASYPVQLGPEVSPLRQALQALRALWPFGKEKKK